MSEVRYASQNGSGILDPGSGQGCGMDAHSKALAVLFSDGSGLAMLYLIESTSVWVSAI